MNSPVMQTADRAIAGTYLRYPIALTSGHGCRLVDDAGREYIDFLAGIAVCNFGHAHPAIVQALTEQARRLWHVSNLFYTEPQTACAQWLTEHSFADRVFFCNSGAEANEAAFKLARHYFKLKNQPQRFRIISMEQSFHGRTMAALSATGQEKVRQGFDPILEGFDFVPFNDCQAIERAIGPQTCAVLMEPIQGEGGVVCAAPDYLKRVRQICDRHDLLLIFDEIQTGMGRTGQRFAYEHAGVAPDIMTLAKALANGLPMGAMLATEAAAQAFGPGVHASTFGGTPIVCAAALAVMKLLDDDPLLAHVRDTGDYFKQRLQWLTQHHTAAVQVRGQGLLLGLVLTVPGADIVTACREHGFLINCIQNDILRFAPPLIITRDDIDALITCLDRVLTQHDAVQSGA